MRLIFTLSLVSDLSAELLVGYGGVGSCNFCLGRLGDDGGESCCPGIHHYGDLLAGYGTIVIPGNARKSPPVEDPE